jgi:HlyD family secretion protein
MTEVVGETRDTAAPKPTAAPSRTPAIIVALTILAIVAISLWYLVQPQPAAVS